MKASETKNEQNRATWLKAVLERIPKGSRILDAGAGEQQYKGLCEHLEYISQDFGKYDGTGNTAGLQMGSWNQRNLDIQSDITAIPEPDASFDAILCSEVLEHLPQPLLAIAEFSRLLRPGGHLILTAPFCSLTHFAPYHFYTGFNRYFYETHLAANDFEIVELRTNGNYFLYLAQELFRLPSISERYGHDHPRPWERLAVHVVCNMLKRFNSKDAGSAELLSFGLHVLAVKKSSII